MNLTGTSYGFVLVLLNIQLAESCVDPSGISCLWYFWFILFWIGIGIFVLVVILVNKIQQRANKVDDIFLKGYKRKPQTTSIQQIICEEKPLQCKETNNMKQTDETTYPPEPSADRLHHVGYNKPPFVLTQKEKNNEAFLALGQEQNNSAHSEQAEKQEPTNRAPAILAQEQERDNKTPIQTQSQNHNSWLTDTPTQEQEHNSSAASFLAEQEQNDKTPETTQNNQGRETFEVCGLENDGHPNNTSDPSANQQVEISQLKWDATPPPTHVQTDFKDTDPYSNLGANTTYTDENCSSTNKTFGLGSPSFPSLTEPETPDLCHMDIINEESHPTRYKDIDHARANGDTHAHHGTDILVSEVKNHAVVLEDFDKEVLESNHERTIPENTVHNKLVVTVDNSSSDTMITANAPTSLSVSNADTETISPTLSPMKL